MTVTQESYIFVLEQIWGELEEHEHLDDNKQWFELNGSPLHTVDFIMGWLREMFGKRLISQKAEVEWESSLLGQNPQISSYRVSSRPVSTRTTLKTIVALKAAITKKTQVITQEECARVSASLHTTFN